MKKILILALSLSMISAFAQRGKKQAFLGLNTTKVFFLAGETSGTEYTATEYMEEMGKVIGYEHWVTDDISVFGQYDLKRDIDFTSLLATGTSSVGKPANDLSVGHLAIGANYHIQFSESADFFIGGNYTTTTLDDYTVDPSLGMQFGLGFEVNQLRIAMIWKRNLVEADWDDGDDKFKADIDYLYLTFGYLF